MHVVDIWGNAFLEVFAESLVSVLGAIGVLVRPVDAAVAYLVDAHVVAHRDAVDLPVATVFAFLAHGCMLAKRLLEFCSHSLLWRDDPDGREVRFMVVGKDRKRCQ